jgi:hypothetical protein
LSKDWNLSLDPRGPHSFVHGAMMGIVTEADSATGLPIAEVLQGRTPEHVANREVLVGLGLKGQ